MSTKSIHRHNKVYGRSETKTDCQRMKTIMPLFGSSFFFFSHFFSKFHYYYNFCCFFLHRVTVCSRKPNTDLLRGDADDFKFIFTIYSHKRTGQTFVYMQKKKNVIHFFCYFLLLTIFVICASDQAFKI